jgi:multicomponent K+:H+ antiporter subunit D
VLFWESPRACGNPARAEPTAAMAPPATPALQHAAIALLLAAVVACAAAAGPISSYAAAAGAQLFDRRPYVDAVLGATPVPPAYDVRREMRERGEAK